MSSTPPDAVVETIACGTCQARIASDLVTPAELQRLRESFAPVRTDLTAVMVDPAQPVRCPWCGVGELKITDIAEVIYPVKYTYRPGPRPRSPDATLAVDFTSASKGEWCI